MVTLEQDLELDLSRLRWIKVVTPFGNYKYRWAFSHEAITDLAESYKAKIIDLKIDFKYRLTIFPLGFKREYRQEEIKCGDLIALTQRGKITHIVEVLDDKYYKEETKEGTWYHGSKQGSWFKCAGSKRSMIICSGCRPTYS
jgi:hypothetical protein